MKKTDLEIFYNSLIPNLWEEFIFFVPDINIPNDIIEKTQGYDLKKFLNKVFVIDTYDGPILYQHGRNNAKITLKGTRLESNLFQLLEREKINSDLEFSFILKKYLEQIECLKYISEWMVLNLNQVENVDQTIKGLFQIQLTYYEKHFRNFINQFYKTKRDNNKTTFNLESIIKSHIKEIVEKNENLRINGVSHVFQNATLNKNSQRKLKKPPLITHEEAEKQLLKTLFKLDVDMIN